MIAYLVRATADQQPLPCLSTHRKIYWGNQTKFLPAAKRQVKCWRRSKKKRKKEEKGHVSFFIAILASLPGIFSTGPIIWVSMDLPGPKQSHLRQFGPRGQIFGPRTLWPQI